MKKETSKKLKLNKISIANLTNAGKGSRSVVSPTTTVLITRGLC
jgi:hypothetical protein